MLRFFKRKPSLGIEITGSEVRLAALSGAGSGRSSVEFSRTALLAAGQVSPGYGAPNILDANGLTETLRECLSRGGRPFRRTALSLPDGVFRVQTLEFDELPSRSSDRDRLIRWRLEKAAAFDLTGTVLRFQVLKQRESGITILACVAKKSVIEQYEQVLLGLGLEPWRIGPSSFHIVSLYFPVITRKTPAFALAHLTEDSFAAIVMERGGTRFYRFKEMKRGAADDIKARFMREIEDSLHFYSHMDRTQISEVKHLYLAGDKDLPYELADGLSAATSLSVEVLSPADAIAAGTQRAQGPDQTASLAAAMGAGRAL